MKQKEFQIIYLDQTYNVVVTYKSQRNVYYRYRNGVFYVTAPYLTSSKFIMNGINKYAPKLLKKTEVKEPDYSFEKREIYLLGEKKELSIIGESKSSDSFEYFDEIDFNKKLKKYALKYIESRVRKYEEIMMIDKPYKVRLKNMKTRYGSNSISTHSLSFMISLIHFGEEIIDSVVVHELAHHFYRGHQTNFYKCVLKYCPNYWELKRKLNRRIHK